MNAKRRPLRRLAYRPVDAAEACGVSERTFYNWLKDQNPPPHFRKNGAIVVPRKPLENWLQQQHRNAAAERQRIWSEVKPKFERLSDDEQMRFGRMAYSEKKLKQFFKNTKLSELDAVLIEYDKEQRNIDGGIAGGN